MWPLEIKNLLCTLQKKLRRQKLFLAISLLFVLLNHYFCFPITQSPDLPGRSWCSLAAFPWPLSSAVLDTNCAQDFFLCSSSVVYCLQNHAWKITSNQPVMQATGDGLLIFKHAFLVFPPVLFHLVWRGNCAKLYPYLLALYFFVLESPKSW